MYSGLWVTTHNNGKINTRHQHTTSSVIIIVIAESKSRKNARQFEFGNGLQVFLLFYR
jgi:hypothetical protein